MNEFLTSINKIYKADIYQYNAVVKDNQRVFTNADELNSYGNLGILDPSTLSLYNLFINGVLQPYSNYTLEKGILTLTTDNLPYEGSPLLLNCITYRQKTSPNSVIVNGNIPSGSTCNQCDALNKITLTETNLNSHLLNNIDFVSNCTSCFSTLYSGYNDTFNSTCKIKNNTDTALVDLKILTTVFLDSYNNIMPTSDDIPCSVESNTIIWSIDLLNPNEEKTLSYSVNGHFNFAGLRILDSSFFIAQTTSGQLISNTISGQSYTVSEGLNLTNTIINGPTSITPNSIHSWDIEVNLHNNTDVDLADVKTIGDFTSDSFHLTNITVKDVSMGSISSTDSAINWHIDLLSKRSSALLFFTVDGFFSAEGYNCLDSFMTFSLSESLLDAFDHQIVSNPSTDIKIYTTNSQQLPSNALSIKNNITNGLLDVGVHSENLWEYDLTVLNNTDHNVSNTIVTNNILLDSIHFVKAEIIPVGSCTISDKTITWNIPTIPANSSVKSHFILDGSFDNSADQVLDRAYIYVPDINGSPFISPIVSSPIMHVLPSVPPVPKPIPLPLDSDFHSTCIITDKVYSHCQQRECFENVNVNIGNKTFENITFHPGYIVEGTLVITPLSDRPNFSRVMFTLRVPFTIMTTDGTLINGFLPDILKDVVLFMPTTRDEFSFNIVVETSSKLLNKPYQVCDDLSFSAGVFLIIKVVGRVQLFIPVYNITPDILPCEEFNNEDLCDDFYKDNFPEFYPRQYETIYEADNSETRYKSHSTSLDFDFAFSNSDTSNNDPNVTDLNIQHVSPNIIQSTCQELPLFGKLCISEAIIEGPTTIGLNDVGTWKTQLTVTNSGNGILSNLSVINNVTIDNIEDVDVLSISQGNYSIESDRIIWNIGDLDASNAAVLVSNYTGSFTSTERPIAVENKKYNTMSDGVKTQFTNADELTDYSSNGIPDPDNVSFFNLYVNGVLQPSTNYTVQEGLLSLTTSDIPIAGSPIILQYYIMKDLDDILLKTTCYHYNALGSNKSCYTDSDEILGYGEGGIPDPLISSYTQLYVNGVLQPKVNYALREGTLDILTTNTPTKDAPIVTQFVTINSDQ